MVDNNTAVAGVVVDTVDSVIAGRAADHAWIALMLADNSVDSRVVVAERVVVNAINKSDDVDLDA